MAPLCLTDELRQKFLDILVKNEITEEVENIILSVPQHLKGQHFGSSAAYIKILFKNGEEKNLFVKMFANTPTSQWAKDLKIMEKEAAFFNEFLPRLKEFCEKHESINSCVELLNFFPKCFYADENMVVLENLVLNEGFVMLDKNIKQDLVTAKLVLEHLATFHAANHAFILEACGGIGNFRENKEWDLICREAAFPDKPIPMIKGMFNGCVGTCINILEGNPIEGSEEAINVLQRDIGKPYEILHSIIKYKPENKLQVVNHGDFHNNNLLFKTEDKGTKVMFVDLQITRLGSPAMDIGHYCYTSLQPEVRRAHLEELLRYYYSNFSKALQRFGKHVPISFDDFYDDYRINSDLGYFFTLSIMTAIGAMQEGLDLGSLSKDKEEMQKEYKTAIGGWIERNPEKALEITQKIVAMVREREVLQRRQ